MADIVSPAVRSRMMSGIRSKDTKPEILVRRFLHSRGLRFRLHRSDLPGRPDIVLPRYRSVVFIHGCFWHQHPGCRFAYMPKSNIEKWQAKFAINAARDAAAVYALTEAGWSVYTIWECEAGQEAVLEDLVAKLRGEHD